MGAPAPSGGRASNCSPSTQARDWCEHDERPALPFYPRHQPSHRSHQVLAMSKHQQKLLVRQHLQQGFFERLSASIGQAECGATAATTPSGSRTGRTRPATPVRYLASTSAANL